MPELAEVARILHFIHKELVGKTILKVQAQHDDLIFGKVGTSAAEFQKHMQGKTITGAGQQGKYFWMVMSSPPHPVMHFGMTGWLKIRGAETYYHPENNGSGGEEEWPPKFWKFLLETDGTPKTEAAFTDARRLGRVRLVDCPADEIRNHTPLKENGPDPVVDKQLVTEEWLRAKLRKKKVPVKAFLLDQSQISGLGNWMGDEVLYHAQIHPEQYSDSLDDKQVKELHSAIHYVCATSVDLLGDSSQFPDDWLFRYRWNKGKKNAPQLLPNGDTITFITVGGRTSAVVPAVQKKTGPVAGDIPVEEEEGSKAATKRTKSRRAAAKKEETDNSLETTRKKVTARKAPPPKATARVNDNVNGTESDAAAKKSTGRKRKAAEKEPEKTATKTKATAKKSRTAARQPAEAAVGLRRGRSAAKKE
ncbi:hypothetical protein VTO42DRAFT_4229 [Malbranchea cinnamomea]